MSSTAARNWSEGLPAYIAVLPRTTWVVHENKQLDDDATKKRFINPAIQSIRRNQFLRSKKNPSMLKKVGKFLRETFRPPKRQRMMGLQNNPASPNVQSIRPRRLWSNSPRIPLRTIVSTEATRESTEQGYVSEGDVPEIDVSTLRRCSFIDLFDLEEEQEVYLLVRKDSPTYQKLALNERDLPHLQTFVNHELRDFVGVASQVKSGIPTKKDHFFHTSDYASAQTILEESIQTRQLSSAGSLVLTSPCLPDTDIPINVFNIQDGAEIQLWRDELETIRESYRPYLCSFPTGHVRNVVFAQLLHELEGDVVKTAELLFDYQGLRNDTLYKRILDKERTIKKLQQREDATAFLEFVDNAFKRGIERSLDGLTRTNRPIVTYAEASNILEKFQNDLPITYKAKLNATIRPGGGKRNPSFEARMKMLIDMLIEARQYSQKRLKYFALVMKMATEARGESGTAVEILEYLRIESSRKTMTRFQKAYDAKRKDYSDILRDYQTLGAGMDNSQIVQGAKYQTGPDSSNSIATTCRFVKKRHEPSLNQSYFYDIKEGLPERINYVEPKIPAPPGMPPMELLDSPASLEKFVKDLNEKGVSPNTFGLESTGNDIPYNPEKQEPTSGARMKAYVDCIRRINKAKEVQRFLGTSKVRKKAEDKAVDEWNISQSELENLLEVLASARSARPVTQLAGNKAHRLLVKTWNHVSDVVDEILILPNSRYNETTINGTGAVVIELLIDLGILIKPEPEQDEDEGQEEDRQEDNQGNNQGKTNNSGNQMLDALKLLKGIKLADGWDKRVIELYGDCLTVDYLESIIRRLEEKQIGNLESEDIFQDVLKAIRRIRTYPGDWHTSLHWLVVIFILHYGGFLQPIQAEIGFKNIIRDPTERYQKSADFLFLVLSEIQRDLWLRWAVTESAKEANSQGVYAMVDGYFEYIEECHQKAKDQKDEVLQFILNFVKYSEEFFSFNDAIAVADSPLIEYYYSEFMPVFTMLGKRRYKKVCLRQMEALYDKENSSVLYLLSQRINRGVLLNEGKSHQADDSYCEHINRLIEDTTTSKDQDALIRKSRFLSAYRQCQVFFQLFFRSTRKGKDHAEADEDNVNRPESDPYCLKVNPPKSTTKPSRKRVMKRIFRMIRAANLCKLTPNRPLEEIGLWDLVGTFGGIKDEDSDNGSQVSQVSLHQQESKDMEDGYGSNDDEDEQDAAPEEGNHSEPVDLFEALNRALSEDLPYLDESDEDEGAEVSEQLNDKSVSNGKLPMKRYPLNKNATKDLRAEGKKKLNSQDLPAKRVAERKERDLQMKKGSWARVYYRHLKQKMTGQIVEDTKPEAFQSILDGYVQMAQLDIDSDSD